MSIKSIIVAVAENNVIGKDNKLIWHISDDLKRFKALTMGHSIIMGRKTFESIGKPLPGRRSVIITRNRNYSMEGCEVVHSLEAALELTKTEEEVFIIGGAEIYKQAIVFADKIYLTSIFHSFDGDTFFPEIKENEWKLVEKNNYKADEKNPFAYSYMKLERRG